MKASSHNYLGELKDHLLSFACGLRARRAYSDLLQVEIAEDIRADAHRQQGRVGRLAYTAEQSDLEAARLIAAAQSPDSEGGRSITPHEAAPVIRCITRSVHTDHQITEALA